VKRLLLNGSPRGRDANSRKILTWLAQGMEGAGVSLPAIMDLAPDPMRTAVTEAFLDADEVLFAFPLYTDSMPGLVKAFLEAIASADPARLRGKRVAFVIQSGFSEGIHTEALASYLARLCQRLGFTDLGTLRKGGMEAIRMLPAKKVAKIQTLFVQAGHGLASLGRFSPELVRTMAEPRTYGLGGRTVIRVATGVTGFRFQRNQRSPGTTWA